jgi:hypothetical protein
MVNVREAAHLNSIFWFILFLQCFPCKGTGGYVLINRTGKTSEQLVRELQGRFLRVVNPTDIGPILVAEINNNDRRCNLTNQFAHLCQHLREQGHGDGVYALKARRRKPPDSKYRTNSKGEVSVFEQIVRDLVNLLLSGRVSFSVGKRQGPFNPPRPEPPRDEYGFVLYANIDNHSIGNLLSPSGKHKGTDTNYIRIAFRFMDRVRIELDSLGVPDPQLIIVTMFPENPASDGLRDSILPNGVDVVTGNPMGAALGAPPPPPAADSRMAPVL